MFFFVDYKTLVRFILKKLKKNVGVANVYIHFKNNLHNIRKDRQIFFCISY